MRAFPALVLLAGFLIAADGPKERARPRTKDQEAIQGAWKVVDATVSGKKLEGTDLGEYGILRLDKLNIVFVVKGDKWQAKVLDQTQGQGTFKLDPEKKPKAIDLVIADEKMTIPGIYSLEEDKLRLCFPGQGNEKRPSDFSSTENNKWSLSLLERMKSGVQPRLSNPLFGGACRRRLGGES